MTESDDAEDDGDAAVNAGGTVGCEVVEFQSLEIEAEVRRLTGISEGPIPGEALIGITELHVPGSSGGLGGVECMHELEQLYAYYSILSTLSPLSGLRYLKLVHIEGTGVNDLSALSGLPQLEWINASDNQITDVSNLVLPRPPVREFPADCGRWVLRLEGNPLIPDDVGVLRLCELGWEVGWSERDRSEPGSLTPHCNTPPPTDCLERL